MSTTVTPLGDRILVRREDATTEKTSGGIIIPDTAKEKPQQGVVEAVGPGKRGADGERHAPSVKKGDRVLFGKYAGSEVKIGGAEYTIMSETEVLAVLEG